MAGLTDVRPRPDETPRSGAGLAATLSILLLATVAVQLAGHRLGWQAYALVRDLPWAGLALSAGALAGAAVGRWWPRLAARASRLRRGVDAWRRAGAVVAGLSAVLIALPLVVPFDQGLSLRVSLVGEVAPEATPAARVSRPSLGRGAEPRIDEGSSASLRGWLYAPVSGRYRFFLRTSDRAVLWLDGTQVAAAGPGARPEGLADLGTGFHRLELLYSPEAGDGRLEVRWTPPHATRTWRIPSVYLLSDSASTRARDLRALLLGLQRAGGLALALLLIARLGRSLAATGRGAEFFRGGRRLPQLAVFALLFLLLADASFLYLPERLAGFRAALLVLLLLGGLRLLIPVRVPPSGSRRPRLPPSLRTGLALLPLLAIQAVLAAHFVGVVDGRLIFSDDHGSFLYRYHMLDHTFPRLVNYDPWWNAGTLDDSAVGGGASNVFLLAWPLIRLLSLESAYVWFIPMVAIFVAPLSLFATTRLLGLPRLAALIAALLALAPEEHYFVWLLPRGTLPALVSASLAPLAFALGWRIFFARDRRWWTLLVFLAVVNLGSFWTLFPLMVLPGLLAGAVTRRGLRLGDLGLALALGGLLLLVNAGWIGEFLRTREVRPLVEAQAVDDMPWGTWWERLTTVIPATENPVGVVMGCIGLLLLPRPLRLPYGVLTASLVLIPALGPDLFPHLELLRFVIPLGFILLPPAAHVVARGLRPMRRGLAVKVGVLLSCTLILMFGVHLWEVWARFSNETHRRVGFMPQETRRLVEWLRENASEDGRVLFAGRVVHQYGGHIAYLQPLTGRPMVAASYYHGPWGGGRIPPELLDDPPSLRRYLALLNIRYVVADSTDGVWWPRLRGIPWLRLREESRDIAVYETDIEPGYLLGGRGTVTFDYNKVAVRLAEPTDDLILKFRWVEGLTFVPPLSGGPVEAWPGLPLIGVRPGGVLSFEVRY